ncbi:MAG: hypothetical protein JW714_01500 [Candidatus Omnitrophica bacterium]|nr:hypothetical protein [Candidatus Omnitrophota bacterium]
MKKDKIFLATIGILCVILALALFWKLRPEVDEKISVRKNAKGEFKLLVGTRPYLIKGVVYQPVPIGQSHQYNFWTDPAKPWREDAPLMRRMGVNTVRFFQPGADAAETREVIGELYHSFGIRSILGHWMDYWKPGNYADDNYRQKLTQDVLEMVNAYKDQEGILLWILGNENNLSWHSGARISWSTPEVEEIEDPYKQEMAKARIYYSLVNQIAREIKKVDPKHPVALGNADIYALEIAKEACPDIDLVALTAYRGKSFGNLWREIKQKLDKPILIMEFGCDSFNAQTGQEDQMAQATFLTSQWRDIQRNISGGSGEGNALGGCIFEWNDEWWKHDEFMPASWYAHDTVGDWSSGAYYFDISAPNNMNVNEEWWGIVELSPELEQGINKRIPRQAYFELQKLWKGADK